MWSVFPKIALASGAIWQSKEASLLNRFSAAKALIRAANSEARCAPRIFSLGPPSIVLVCQPEFQVEPCLGRSTVITLNQRRCVSGRDLNGILLRLLSMTVSSRRTGELPAKAIVQVIDFQDRRSSRNRRRL